MMQGHPLFDELDASLAALVPREPVEIDGRWLPSGRRTYRAARQAGTGTGRFVEVVDLRWQGTLTCAVPIAGIAFLVTASELFWVKSAPPARSLPVAVSLHAYADHSLGRATFVAGLGGSVLPGVPVACGGDLSTSCTVRTGRLTTGCMEQLARADDAAFVVLLVQRQFVTVSRHHLWRVRDEVAVPLPPSVREILTRRRTGTIRPVPRTS